MLSLILSSVAVIGGLAVVLGENMARGDGSPADDGRVTLTLNDDKELTVPVGSSLLYTLFQQKYYVPSACGGKGKCGYCRVKVLEGGGPLMPTETAVLTPEEVADHWRLSCQVKVRQAMRVWIPPEYFTISEYEGVVERAESVTPNIRELTFRLVNPPRIIFQAGQYVQVQAVGPNGETIYRAYSMAGLPSRRGSISLNVRLEPGGICSTYLFGLKEGDPVRFSGPYGEFLFSHSGRNACCMATGVGLAPFRSLIPQMLVVEGIEVFLFFGARERRDLYGLADIEKWKRNPRFHFIPCLSGEGEKDWGGEWGRIDAVFFGRYFEEHKGDEFYICSSPVVVNGLTAQLEERRVPESRIHFDKFG